MAATQKREPSGPIMHMHSLGQMLTGREWNKDRREEIEWHIKHPPEMPISSLNQKSI